MGALVTDRPKRVDAGRVRQTERDARALEWLSQMYAAPLDTIAKLCGTTEHRAYAVVGRWTRAGWAETGRVDAGPMWVWPTRATATAYLAWDAGLYRPKASTAVHTKAVAEVRLAVAGDDPAAWVSERQIRHNLHGWKQAGQALPHTPDGVWKSETGDVAVEVELTAKAPERQKQIIGDVMAMAGKTGSRVLYVTRGPGVKAAVERAAAAYAQAFRQDWPAGLEVKDYAEVVR